MLTRKSVNSSFDPLTLGQGAALPKRGRLIRPRRDYVRARRARTASACFNTLRDRRFRCCWMRVPTRRALGKSVLPRAGVKRTALGKIVLLARAPLSSDNRHALAPCRTSYLLIAPTLRARSPYVECPHRCVRTSALQQHDNPLRGSRPRRATPSTRGPQYRGPPAARNILPFLKPEACHQQHENLQWKGGAI